MSPGGTVSAHGKTAARVLSMVADRQLAVGITWAVPALCFALAVYVMHMIWIGNREGPGLNLDTARSPRSLFFGLSVVPSAPHGWRSPPD
jgi:hypothetical protein